MAHVRSAHEEDVEFKTLALRQRITKIQHDVAVLEKDLDVLLHMTPSPDTTTMEAPKQRWREDGRCGPLFPAPGASKKHPGGSAQWPSRGSIGHILWACAKRTAALDQKK